MLQAQPVAQQVAVAEQVAVDLAEQVAEQVAVEAGRPLLLRIPRREALVWDRILSRHHLETRTIAADRL